MDNESGKPTEKELKLELPDDDPDGFALLVKWLYQGQLDDMSDMTDDEKYEYAVACHKLYMLCDKFDLPLKNEAIDRYRQGLHEAQLVPDAAEISDIYRSSPIGSPFRKLMTQIAARQIMDPGSDKSAESYHKCFEANPDFAVDMVNAIKAGTGGLLFDDPTEENQCDYHDHSEGQDCQFREFDAEIPLSPVKRLLAYRSKSTESAPQLTLQMDLPDRRPSQLPRSNSTEQQLRLMLPVGHKRRRRSSASTGSNQSSASTTSAGSTTQTSEASTNATSTYDEILSSPPELLKEPELLPVAEEESPEAEPTQEGSQTGPPAAVAAAVVKPPLQRRKTPLSYVGAQKRRFSGEGHPDEMKSRGLWDYWRGKEGAA